MTSRFSSESISVPACVLTVATFDQRVSVRRSSNGKSNKVESICVVNSIETRSTQSNTSPRGSSCKMRIARSRIVEDIFARFGGTTIGDDLALLVVPRRIHRDETFLPVLQRDVFQRDAPKGGIGGIHLM